MAAQRAGIDERAPTRSRVHGSVATAIVLVVLAAIGWAAVRAMGGGALGQDPFGRQAPAFRLPRLQGDGSVALADYRGKPVVLNFWASWCEPCKGEAPILASAQRRWSNRGVIFLGVDTKDRQADGRTFQALYGMQNVSVVDTQGMLGASYGVLGFPETFFIGRDGTIVAKYVGPIDSPTLDANVASIVER